MRFFAFAAAVLAAAGLTGCESTVYHVPPRHILSPDETPASTLGSEAVAGDTIVRKFKLAYDASYAEDGEPSRALTFARYGMTLVDIRCDLFFEQIGRGAQTGDFVRREFQSVTAALVAALGLTTIGKDAITGVGIGSALAIQTLDNYSTVYFFSPDVSAVQKLVRRTLELRREELLSAQRAPRTFDAAVGAVRAYQNLCTAHEIKRLVTEAVDPDRPAIGRFGDVPAAIYSDAAKNALGAMGKALDVNSLSLKEAMIVELLRAPPASWGEAQVDYACSVLAGNVRAAVCQPKTAGSTTWVARPAPADPELVRRLEVGWATLRALDGPRTEAMKAEQAAVISQTGPVYASMKQALAKAEASATQTEAVKKEIRELTEEIGRLKQRSASADAAVMGEPEPTPPSVPAPPEPPPAAAGGSTG